MYSLRADSVRAWGDFRASGEAYQGVWDVALDPDGLPWIAFSPGVRQGPARLDAEGEIHFVRPPGAESARSVWSITFDEGVRLWAGTEGGILLYSEGLWSRFDESTGLPAVNVWPLALDSASVLAGTKGGGLVIMSRQEADNPPPRVVIWNATPEDRALRVRHSALGYWGDLKSDAIDTRHRMDGGTWSAWSTRRERVVPGLSPGGHTIEIQARGLFGQLSEPAGASFRIMPPLILRPAFALPVGGLLLALLTVGTMATLRRIRQDRDLRLSEQRLRTMLDNAPEAIAIYDVGANRFTEANEKALTLFSVEHGNISEVAPESLTAGRLQVDGEGPMREYLQAALRGEGPHLRLHGAGWRRLGDPL